jgi:hypothetical protein
MLRSEGITREVADGASCHLDRDLCARGGTARCVYSALLSPSKIRQFDRQLTKTTLNFATLEKLPTRNENLTLDVLVNLAASPHTEPTHRTMAATG